MGRHGKKYLDAAKLVERERAFALTPPRTDQGKLQTSRQSPGPR